ncbi:2OG-Fe(II) oxygenase [Tenacibaculum sp. IB213877]|uniref:2OG-Fe(II) oxygenase n=1 Tax=Tenacibaculum sp. IB213877 TaxID=3097351 RepID=UPI002A5A3D0E|nr:2OG-Fe(II) oxygenase [Tenacibaculum sp. IB213877]MDY0781212.1 2OG-Fe(II) oxygenase [Tenacibaculum sp. IB213877]
MKYISPNIFVRFLVNTTFVEETNEQQYERLITGLADNEFGLCNAFFDDATVSGLRTNLLTYYKDGFMQPAGIGKNFDYVKNAEIRGDVIRWINEASTDIFEKAFITRIEEFINYLNRTCYTGVNDYEFHYAYYDVGSFYKRHLDQFKADRGRLFSFVLYLNDDWRDIDGGKLSIYTKDNEESVYPFGGRVVFFKSDVTEHEVHPSPNRPRLSIAGWLKKV